MPLSADLGWQPRTPGPRRLSEVAAVVRASTVVPDLLVTGIAQDSRLVQPGQLYAALPGARVHGAEFVEQALELGAVAMLSDRDDDALPVLRVADPRARGAGLRLGGGRGLQPRPGAAPGGRDHVPGGVFTNLGRDHLDLHGDMASYLAANA